MKNQKFFFSAVAVVVILGVFFFFFFGFVKSRFQSSVVRVKDVQVAAVSGVKAVGQVRVADVSVAVNDVSVVRDAVSVQRVVLV
jgi:hypothetical protein